MSISCKNKNIFLKIEIDHPGKFVSPREDFKSIDDEPIKSTDHKQLQFYGKLI